MRSRKPPSWAKAAMVLLCAKTATSTATAGKRPTIASATVPDVASISGSSHSIDDDAFAMIPAIAALGLRTADLRAAEQFSDAECWLQLGLRFACLARAR